MTAQVLRSSAAADGGRCRTRCGSSPSRRHRCDPRPPRTAAAAPAAHQVVAASLWLRSSAAADGGRCRGAGRCPDLGVEVAILGRRGRRPLPLRPVRLPPATCALRSSAAADGGRCRALVLPPGGALPVAILGRRGRRPLPGAGPPGIRWCRVLRSSAAADGGRCRSPTHSRRSRSTSCDPRPPRTAAAARQVLAGFLVTDQLRSSAAADGGRCLGYWGRCSRRRPRCDPRPPRTAAAARHVHCRDHRAGNVAILGRRGRRPLP